MIPAPSRSPAPETSALRGWRSCDPGKGPLAGSREPPAPSTRPQKGHFCHAEIHIWLPGAEVPKAAQLPPERPGNQGPRQPHRTSAQSPRATDTWLQLGSQSACWETAHFLLILETPGGHKASPVCHVSVRHKQVQKSESDPL